MRKALLAAGAALAITGLGMTTPGMHEVNRAALPAAAPQLKQRRRELRSARSAWTQRPFRRGPGWCQAQVQRMARKRRNQQRHRAACKRRGR